jgi:RNA polymerase sigma-70 factor (ECF subfamily)
MLHSAHVVFPFRRGRVKEFAVVSDPRLLRAGGDLEDWIRSARDGSAEALGRLLEECRPYLLLVASQELPPGLRAKAGASDLVQDTLLQAQGHFDRFRDNGETQLLAWLRRILLHRAANLRRRYCGTDKRQLAREVRLTDNSAAGAPDVAASDPSPSSLVAAQEEDLVLRRALERLPDDYRRVVTWRNYDRLPFDEIGRRLGRSAEAARKLWVRAVEHLQQELGSRDEPR